MYAPYFTEIYHLYQTLATDYHREAKVDDIINALFEKRGIPEVKSKIHYLTNEELIKGFRLFDLVGTE